MDKGHQQIGRRRGLVVAPGQQLRPGHMDHRHMQHDAQPHHGGTQVVECIQPVLAAVCLGHVPASLSL